MAVRHTNFANPSLITSLLSATLLLVVGSPHFASAQETKPSQKAAKSTGSAKLIARGKYIVEGVAGCGYCHTPHDKNGDPDRTKWLAGGPVFYQPAQRVAGWPITAPRLAGLPPGSDAEMITLLTTSISRSGRPLRAPMPRFLMTRSDAEAVVADLRSLSSSR
jgi:hypothetical protein